LIKVDPFKDSPEDELSSGKKVAEALSFSGEKTIYCLI